jgi:hypothetical protein
VDSNTTMHQWLEASKPLVHSLADAAAAADHLLNIGAPRDGRSQKALTCRVRQVREWFSANPCPEHALGDQLQLVVAQVSFVSLVLGSEPSTLDRDRMATLGLRLREVNIGLLNLVTEIDKSLERPSQ